ncbi:MAG: hypothetical protein M3Y84_03375 [Acidobacteriota bacterium]|nr:hypothetical protein [Acidobacteriota bacterium]
MLKRSSSPLIFITFCAIVGLGTSTALAQDSVADFHKILREKAAFDETAFAALQEGQTVVRLLPVQDKREVAVCGLVGLEVPSEMFLQSFRESMARKNNPAVLEIGSFSSTPTLDDLRDLTIENGDFEDLKECVVGDCRLKLSARMIERFQKEVNWQAPDYRIQATQLLKRMLLDYVRDYQARGDVALIEYNDKPKEVRLADEQHALMNASGYVNNFLTKSPQYLKSQPTSELRIVENAIVWSKVKFGLKPVLAINHIMIYKREQETGPQILIASKQIYANHYFDSSLALTAYVNIPGANPASYLFYENRSRADGLQGAFSTIKRGVVEGKAVNSLKTILESSRMNLNAFALSRTESAMPADRERGWRGWRVGGLHLFAWLSLITAFAALFSLGNYGWKRRIIGGAPS